MNNLTLSCLALASAGVLWLGQHHAREDARSNQRTLHRELAATRMMVAETTAAVSNAQDLLAARRQELDWARAESAAALHSTQSVTPLAPDPTREGLWPKDKPYCYMSKQHLATIGFVPFSEAAGLTSEAAILFGMSPAERSAVDRAYADFLDQTRQIHLAHAEPLPAKPGANTLDHREVSYRIPAMTNEFRALRAQLDANLRQTLGDSRAKVFLKRAESQLENAYGQFGNKGYTIKYVADRQSDGSVDHHLNFTQLDGQASNGYRIRFPLDPTSGLWKFRHLVGDQPLLEPRPISR
jgi:hypothetical protein